MHSPVPLLPTHSPVPSRRTVSRLQRRRLLCSPPPTATTGRSARRTSTQGTSSAAAVLVSLSRRCKPLLVAALSSALGSILFCLLHEALLAAGRASWLPHHIHDDLQPVACYATAYMLSALLQHCLSAKLPGGDSREALLVTLTASCAALVATLRLAVTLEGAGWSHRSIYWATLIAGAACDGLLRRLLRDRAASASRGLGLAARGSNDDGHDGQHHARRKLASGEQPFATQ
eukprot:PLAT2923.1.p1 GENE.PLAT2923.1~~PLAT2923.1.p1  ORF type:complete len:268 (+),score=18.22 PLAT2923.1:110-805(+)